VTPEHHRRVGQLFRDALELPAGERSSFLSRSCVGDDAMKSEVESLLSYEAMGHAVIDGSALEAAGRAIAAEQSHSWVGRQVSHYRIVSRLGAGGMGEVYRARDTKLGREVAIKILPPHLTAEPERRAPLAREARLLATLNHSHIGAIYGLEESDGITALVLELVEGETLADRLTRGPLPLADSLALARQIADALDAAHERGIVHRDLKPANIKVRDDGTVKVLDFGLAKAVADAGAAESSLTDSATRPAMTRLGVILGTAAYMSPEQARGQPLDKRTDIWAFGCVLYEMLTGHAPFVRPTVTDTLAAVVEQSPNWAALPPATPPRVRHLIARCLEKDRKLRLRDIGDVAPLARHVHIAHDPRDGRGTGAVLEAGQPGPRLLRPRAALDGGPQWWITGQRVPGGGANPTATERDMERQRRDRLHAGKRAATGEREGRRASPPRPRWAMLTSRTDGRRSSRTGTASCSSHKATGTTCVLDR
jgi:eukaryotic-like serine/threonine-protein kinase